MDQQGIQWGREGFERGRNQKQKQKDYRYALQRQIREREQSRRRGRRINNNAVEKTNSAEQLRKITSQHRAPTPEVVSPPSTSNNIFNDL